MFHDRGVNNKVNNLHECSLLIIYKDSHSSFKDLLKKDNPCTTYPRKIQKLAIELFKVKENL